MRLHYIIHTLHRMDTIPARATQIQCAAIEDGTTQTTQQWNNIFITTAPGSHTNHPKTNYAASFIHQKQTPLKSGIFHCSHGMTQSSYENTNLHQRPRSTTIAITQWYDVLSSNKNMYQETFNYNTIHISSWKQKTYFYHLTVIHWREIPFTNLPRYESSPYTLHASQKPSYKLHMVWAPCNPHQHHPWRTKAIFLPHIHPTVRDIISFHCLHDTQWMETIFLKWL